MHNTYQNIYLCIVNEVKMNALQKNNIMKKLLLLFATLLISLNSMALSFPRSTYVQQRALNKGANDKSIILSEAQALNASLTTTVETKGEEEINQVSFIEMFANYLISLFTEHLIQNKSVGMNSFEKSKYEYFAIKQDFDYHVFG